MNVERADGQSTTPHEIELAPLLATWRDPVLREQVNEVIGDNVEKRIIVVGNGDGTVALGLPPNEMDEEADNQQAQFFSNIWKIFRLGS